jgi:hypothetical protein
VPKRRPRRFKSLFRALIVVLLALVAFSTTSPGIPTFLPHVEAAAPLGSATVAPTAYWGPFSGTTGDMQVDINRPGIAVRVEIPREFLQGVVSAENDTSFIRSNIRNDYYYYSVVDESNYWNYAWRGEQSDAPCFKPNFPLRDPNAPWCVEIWNYLNGTFRTFPPPKFIRFRNLNAPAIAGNYSFTLFVADHTNSIGYPDFVHAWNKTLFVPVSASNDPASIAGEICDGGYGGTNPTCPVQATKAVAYAQDTNGQIVGKAFVNETTGLFNITGLYAAPNTGTTYQILASAGFNAKFDVAYSLTSAGSVKVLPGENRQSPPVLLDRAPQLCGAIEYHGVDKSPQRSLSDNPALLAAGLKELNVTVEASGLPNQFSPFRNQTVSLDSANGRDYFRIITGSNTTYVGSDPYGTEFAGLPQANGAPYTLTVNVHVSGYVQEPTEPFTVGLSPAIPCDINQRTIILDVGGVISGTILLKNRLGLETPHQAEASLPLPRVTDALFGGNILIEAYDHSGLIRAVSVINGTNADGTTIYKDEASVPFLLFGFSEYLNRSRSGPWNAEDAGLGPDPSYSIRVYIRGYELQTSTSIPLSLGGNVTGVPLTMLRGGAFQVGVFSYDNRFGSRATQTPLPFIFLNASIPVPARTYFYDSSGMLVGYVQCILRLGILQPDKLCSMGTGRPGSEERGFTIIFAGQNWSLSEIWFYGNTPTHITNDTYTIKTYTLGYVWQYGPVQSPNDLVGFVPASVSLLIGNEIDLTCPVYANPELLGTIPENDHAIGQAFSVGLAGAVPANVTAGTATLRLPIYGFGGTAESNGTIHGQGHFFYVDTDGTRKFDYGLDNETYKVQVPEFGFNRHFLQLVPPVSITFVGLFLEAGPLMNELAMGRVITPPLVYGWASSSAQSDFIFSKCRDCIPLSWVTVTASNGTYERGVSTLDGQFTGAGALNMPEGTYQVTYSVAFYQSQVESVHVQWGGDAASPLLVPLCPVGEDCSSRSSGSIALNQSSPPLMTIAIGVSTRSSFRSMW